MIAYEDFWLKIEPVDQNGWFPVLVVKSPAGEGRSYFQIPFSPDELADIQTSSHQLDSERFSEIGTLLFDALFTGPVLSLFDQSMGRTGERDRGLRIRLNIDPEEPSLAQLTGLPWEYLYRQETREFLNLSRFTPIVRHLNVQRSSAPQPLASPLRILVVISSPNDYDLLDLERERYIIETSWGKEADVQVDFLERATISALQDRLSEYSYHVLHFMGHGVFNQESGRGALLMEDERRRSVILDGPALGTLLHDAPTLRLVFLNACETATTTREDGFDPFTGVAAAIMMAGVPNAIAMQFPISDQAATTFARRFYATVAQGLPVDAAVAESRKSISLANTTSLEWGTPVLFIRSLDDLVLLPPLDKPAIPAGDQPPGIADAQPSAPMPQPSTGSTETNGTAAPAPATGMSRRTLGLVLMALALLVVVVIIGLQLFGGTPKQTASSAEALDVVATISSTDMAFVPAGTYTIGKADGGTLFVATEEHKIDAFWIDKYETTNSQYAAFLAATGSPPPGSWKGGNFPAGQADFPATGISWEQANAYCEWKQKRLPTEAEWEVAARGPRAWLYAWGDESLASAFHTTPTAVGTSLADQSYFGAFDIVHNVQEWVGEGYGPADETSPASRILRGGSFASPADLTQRFVGPGDGPMRIQVAGVRCAADSAAIDPASPPSDVLLQDDFSDPNTGWQIGPDTNPGYHAPDWYHLEAPDLARLCTKIFGCVSAVPEGIGLCTE